jgi:hypothetical protein
MTRSARKAAPRGERPTLPADGPVRVLVSSRALALRDVLALPWVAFRRDWSGAPPPAAAGFTVAADPERLFYVAGCAQAPCHDAGLARGTFAAGLWERDVAELFVGGEGTPAYRELNLSPAGAWWTCAFSGYRQADRDEPAAGVGVETIGEVSAAGWVAGLAVPRAVALPGGQIDRRTRLNACMIVGARDRRYLCWRPAGGTPDFHLPRCFAPVELVAI